MKIPSEPQLEALAKQIKTLSSVEPTVADGSITNAKLAKNAVKSDNIDWTTMESFVWKVGYMGFPDGIPADFSDTIYVPLGDDFPSEQGYIPYLIFFSGWGSTGEIVPGVNWRPCSGCSVIMKNGHKYVRGGLSTNGISVATKSDAIYFIFASKSSSNIIWADILKQKELEAQGEEGFDEPLEIPT